ncbi:hypothetical protein V2J09_007185 [Rumex salicifolius]
MSGEIVGEEYEQLAIADEQSPSDQNRKLKRLKRAFEQPKSPLLDSPLQDDEFESPESPSKSLDSAKSKDELLGSEHRSAGFEREKESEEFDELFPWEGERSGVKRVLEFNTDGDSSDGFGIDRDLEDQALDGTADGKKESKKRVKSNDEGKKERKKKMRDGKPKVSKRKENQERKAEVTLLVEHQRQLRERRDVAFKPLPVIQMPISSVLERIRQRKQEVSFKAASSSSNLFSDPLGEILVDSDSEEVVFVKKEDCKIKSLSKEQVDQTVVKEDHYQSPVDGSDKDLSQLGDRQNPPQMPLVEEKEDLLTAFSPPTNDTQELLSESQDHNSNVETESSQDEDVAPSLPSMNLKLDSAPLDDSSSDDDDDEDEEENDKENINPLTGHLFNENLSPRGDPVKAFLDEEALEDDCSDDERRRFEDDVEGESDAEEVAELIATNYSEKPVDNERRNELHQMWLAQQDEAGTENLLQRLKCKVKQKESAELDEDDDDQSTDEMDVEFGNEEDLPTNATRLNTKQLRKLIPQMFTDKDDDYISSDDEETERRLNKQCLLGKVEIKKHAVLASPAENETSREVFGRIKKLNLVATKKKVKPSSFFQNLVTKGSDSNSSKSSFLNRMSSIPVSSKRASNTVKAFIFGRDDSNSKSSISASEEDSRDRMNQAETSIQRKRTFTAKFSSQARQSTQSSLETSHNTSLIDILKRSSVQTNSFTRDEIMVDHQAAFAAFKPSKRPVKVEARS